MRAGLLLAPVAVVVALGLTACGSVTASTGAAGAAGSAGTAGPPGAASPSGAADPSSGASPSAAPSPSGAAGSPGASRGPAPRQPSLCADQGAVTGLTIQRTGAVVRVPQEMFILPPVTAGPAAARSVARALCALPPQRSATMHCPADLGILYRLRFTAGRQRFGVVTVAASGCRLVRGLGQVRTAAGATAFWQALGRISQLPGQAPVNRTA